MEKCFRDIVVGKKPYGKSIRNLNSDTNQIIFKKRLDLYSIFFVPLGIL